MKISNDSKKHFLPCLYCGVDSGPALSLFFWVVGCALVGSICFYGWAKINKKFDNSEKLSRIPIEQEEKLMSDTESSNQPIEKEIDLLKYKGNDVPRVLRFAWTVLVVFSIFYLIQYMLPDLRIWMEK